MPEPWYRSRSTIPWINGYLCAGQAPPARRLPSRGWPITNTGTSLSLMEFLPIKNSLGFLLLPGELAASLPPLLGHRPAPTRSGPPSPTPDDAVPFSRGYLHADTFGLLRCLVESGPLAVCTAVQTDRYKRGWWWVSSSSPPPPLPPRLARLRDDFSDASRVGGGLRRFFIFFFFLQEDGRNEMSLLDVFFFRVFRLLSTKRFLNSKVIS